MNLPKALQNDMEEQRTPSDPAQRTGAIKKSAPKTVKPKKADAVKKNVKKSEESRIDWWPRVQQYLREVASELRKVVWPSRKETLGSTAVVLVIVLIMGLYLGIVDAILSRFVRLIVG